MLNAIKQSWQDRDSIIYFKISLYLFVAALPFGIGIDALLLLPLGITWWSLSSWKEKKALWYSHRFSLGIIAALFLTVALGLVYSDDIKVALGRTERSLALLVLPIMLFAVERRHLDLRAIFYSLGIGLFVAMLISWSCIALDILSKTKPLEQAKYFFEWIYTDHNLLSTIKMHPGYFALFLVLFMMTLVQSPFMESLRRKKWVYATILALCLLFLVETSSRVGFFCFVVILGMGIFKKFKWSSIAILLIVLLAASQFDYLTNKFEHIVDKEGNITFERYYRWKTILNILFENHNWLFGVGSGDVHEVYASAYENGNFQLAMNDRYNAHNQYIEFLVGSGLFGLVVYIVSIVHFAIKTRLKSTALAFLVLIAVFSLSESFLVRSKGVFFFAFFYTLLLHKLTLKK